MTVDLQSHAEAILRTVFIDLHDFDDADIQECLTACAEMFDAGAKAMQEAAIDVCRQYEAFCGDKPLWPDEPRTSISIIDPADLRTKGQDHD